MSLAEAKLIVCHASELHPKRIRIHLEGMVQGVGLRPHIHRLAVALGLTGWVVNTGDGITVDIEGRGPLVDDFLRRIKSPLPPLARVDRLDIEVLSTVGYTSFAIRHSESKKGQTALVLPDVATCAECLHEIRDPADRRYAYPFTSCTNCGPRFSILEALPYDRANTTMRRFTMCRACRTEYSDPADRRFHAQANACPACGPQLVLLDRSGTVLAERHQALLRACGALRTGQIVALKGLGGFQFLVDARDNEAVVQLRNRKKRPHKPFAIMVPSLSLIDEFCYLTETERKLLLSAAAPIVLLQRRECDPCAPSVAPDNPMLGVMLPYTPLHHLLLDELDFIVVATSGNVADEPLAIDKEGALDRLGEIADLFLVHDRPIACALDDSVVRVVSERPLMLRSARGYAPLSLPLAHGTPSILALGGHLKSTAAISVGAQLIVGPHVGNLNTSQARQVFDDSVDRLRTLYKMHPVAVACDRHPDYYTSRTAERFDLPVVPVQHHVAHIVACMADNGVEGPVLGVAWDGTGYGGDGTIWGGEFIVVEEVCTRRVAHLRPFQLPGGDKAVSEPRRAAAGLLYDVLGESALHDCSLPSIESFTEIERNILVPMLTREVNTPRTSSVGRLFDAIASLIGLAQRTSFEGQAAMALEFAIREEPPQTHYDIGIERGCEDPDAPLILDWRPMIKAILADIKLGIPKAHIAVAFHNAMIDTIVAVARRIGEPRVVLTGGCFQNRYLIEGTVAKLQHAGFEALWHRQLPANDGGLALGQVVWAQRHLAAVAS